MILVRRSYLTSWKVLVSNVENVGSDVGDLDTLADAGFCDRYQCLLRFCGSAYHLQCIIRSEATDEVQTSVRRVRLWARGGASQQSKCGRAEVHFLAQIFRFAVLVTRTVIPKTFWGSDENFEVMMQCLCSKLSRSGLY